MNTWINKNALVTLMLFSKKVDILGIILVEILPPSQSWKQKRKRREGGREKAIWRAPVTKFKFHRLSEKLEANTIKMFPNLNTMFLAALQETMGDNTVF